MIEVKEIHPGSEIEFTESPEHFLVIATEVAKAMGWEVADVHYNSFIAYTSGYSGLPGEQVRVDIAGQSAVVSTEYATGYMADEEIRQANIYNFIQGIHAVKYYFSAEELELKYLQLKALPNFDPLAPPKPVVVDTRTPASLGSVRDYPVTASIIAINVLLFAIMVLMGADVLQPASGMMIDWGANFGLRTLDGEWWRLFTSCFLHFGVVHLLMNMYALVYAGLILEPQLGSKRVAVAYLLTGVVASLTSVWWHSWVVAAGASGAVFGLYGVVLALVTSGYMGQKLRKPMLMSIGFFVLYNLASGMNDGIDSAAHIGGLLSGIVIGYLYVYAERQPNSNRLLYPMLAVLTAVTLSLTAIAYNRIPNALAIYNKEMKTFSQNEVIAETAIQGTPIKTTSQKLKAIEQTSIPTWRQNAVLIESLGKLRFPEEIEKRNKLLGMYAALRIQSLEFEYKALKENTQQYAEPLASITRQMEQIKTSLQPE
ncbi:MAG: rhomboid family intramembrane serine protease [Sphingobacteriales bacterium]|nr:MAG: rhomboid family intramembrane serine protease [Sphingobacteriales bacterium]